MIGYIIAPRKTEVNTFFEKKSRMLPARRVEKVGKQALQWIAANFMFKKLFARAQTVRRRRSVFAEIGKRGMPGGHEDKMRMRLAK